MSTLIRVFGYEIYLGRQEPRWEFGAFRQASSSSSSGRWTSSSRRPGGCGSWSSRLGVGRHASRCRSGVTDDLQAGTLR